jgi:hypothetical protein
LYWNLSCDQHVEIRPLDKYCYSSIGVEPHSFNDLPAIVIGNSFRWYQNGVLHRNGDNVSMIVVQETKTNNKFTFTFYKFGKMFRECGKPSEIVFYNNFTNNQKSVMYHYRYFDYTGYRLPLVQLIYQYNGFVRYYNGKRYFVAPTTEIKEFMESLTNDIIVLGLCFRSNLANQQVVLFVRTILQFVYLGCPVDFMEQLICLVFLSFPPICNTFGWTKRKFNFDVCSSKKIRTKSLMMID